MSFRSDDRDLSGLLLHPATTFHIFEIVIAGGEWRRNMRCFGSRGGPKHKRSCWSTQAVNRSRNNEQETGGPDDIRAVGRDIAVKKAVK